MVDNNFIAKMFNLPQETHPEKLWVLSQIRDEDEVIYDLGCGTHKTLDRAIGVDLNPVADMIDSIDNMPLIADCSADIIISRHSLEHMLDLVRTLKEWRRILKPTGKIIVILPNHGELNTMDTWISQNQHMHAFSRASFDLLIYIMPGLKIEKLEDVVPGWSFGAIIKSI